MNSRPYNEIETRQQIRDFAHQLDASSLILKAVGFRVHKLRDTVDALQGAAGGRREFELSHAALAKRLEHSGEGKTAETYASRKVAALDKEQRRVGVLLFDIQRGGGMEHRRTRYVDYLTPAANWAMQQARASEQWKEHPAKALGAQIPAAVGMLPSAEAVAEEGSDNSYMTPFEVRLARNRKHALSRACANFALLKEAHGDIRAHAQALASEILERAVLIEQGMIAEEMENEPLQICRGSEVEGDAPAEEEIEVQDAALAYARVGIPVFPVKADKSPYTVKGFKDASTDECTIRAWWRKWPDAGIGVPTGEASGWLVLDIDPRHGGDASFTALMEAHGALPETLEAATGGGGHHIVLDYPKGSNIRNSAGKKLGEGLDVRAEGGYIVVAPSLHASGKRYRWLNSLPPAPLPEWLLERLTAAPPVVAAAPDTKTRPQGTGGAQIGEVIGEGGRNDALFKIGCSMRGKGASGDEIEAELLDINARRCAPPLPAPEVQKIARSAANYSANRVAVGV